MNKKRPVRELQKRILDEAVTWMQLCRTRVDNVRWGLTPHSHGLIRPACISGSWGPAGTGKVLSCRSKITPEGAMYRKRQSHDSHTQQLAILRTHQRATSVP